MSLLSPGGDTNLDQFDREVALLLDVVRLSRVTVAYAEVTAATRDFIRFTLVPLLHCMDSSGQRTVPVPFDAWGDDPLAALYGCIEETARRNSAEPARLTPAASLRETLRTWEERLDVAFIIILDQFEPYLAAAADGEGTTPFEEELIEALTDPKLRSNFVLLVRDDHGPLVSQFLGRIPALGEASVRLPRSAPLAGGLNASEGVSASQAAAYLPATAPAQVLEIAPADSFGVQTEDAPRERPGTQAPIRASDIIPAHASRADDRTEAHNRTRYAVVDPSRSTRSNPRRLQAALAAVACVLAGALYIVITMSVGTDSAASLEARSAPHAPRAEVSKAPDLPLQETGATVALAEPVPGREATSSERVAERTFAASANATAPPARSNGKPRPAQARPAYEADMRTAQATAPRPPPAAAAKPAPQAVRSIDVVYRQRAADECNAGPVGFVCREAIRRELCHANWSSTQARGRSICHVREAATPLGD